jgi:hypothetical protein
MKRTKEGKKCYGMNGEEGWMAKMNHLHGFVFNNDSHGYHFSF